MVMTVEQPAEWMFGRGNRSTRRKPAAVPFRRPEIPHDLSRARTRDAAVGSRRLTTWAMAQPKTVSNNEKINIVQQDGRYYAMLCTYQWPCWDPALLVVTRRRSQRAKFRPAFLVSRCIFADRKLFEAEIAGKKNTNSVPLSLFYLFYYRCLLGLCTA
jgi:hypothetical protein